MDIKREFEIARQIHRISVFQREISLGYISLLTRLKNLVFILNNQSPDSSEYHTARAVYASSIASFLEEGDPVLSISYLGRFYQIIPSEEEAENLRKKCIEKYLRDDTELVVAFRRAERYKTNLGDLI